MESDHAPKTPSYTDAMETSFSYSPPSSSSFEQFPEPIVPPSPTTFSAPHAHTLNEANYSPSPPAAPTPIAAPFNPPQQQRHYGAPPDGPPGYDNVPPPQQEYNDAQGHEGYSAPSPHDAPPLHDAPPPYSGGRYIKKGQNRFKHSDSDRSASPSSPVLDPPPTPKPSPDPPSFCESQFNNTTSTRTVPAVDPNTRTGTTGIADSPSVKNSDTTDNVETIRKSFAVMAPDNKLFPPGKRINYSFLKGSKAQRKLVRDVAKECNRLCNIKFRHIEENGILRISFDQKGNWSHVGQDNLAIKGLLVATMNFDCRDGSDVSKGTIRHEFGHVLGFLHEHQSPARMGRLTLKKDDVYKYYKQSESSGWDKETIESEVIHEFSSTEVSNYSKLDSKSIMMYPIDDTLNEEKIDIPRNNTFSDTDKAWMAIQYPYSPSHSDAWKLLNGALLTTGVDLETIGHIKLAHDAEDFTEIRILFRKFQLKRREEEQKSTHHRAQNSARRSPRRSSY